jgi:hypothetical protein
MAKIQDKQVTKLCSNNVIGVCRCRKSLANCERWPTYEGGQLHKCYCIRIHEYLGSHSIHMHGYLDNDLLKKLQRNYDVYVRQPYV